MTREDLRALRELANAAVDPDAPPPVMGEAYGTLLLRLIQQHEAAAPWTESHWTEYERSIVAAEREACAKVCDAVVDQLRALHRATMGYEDACVLRGAELVADALKETREGAAWAGWDNRPHYAAPDGKLRDAAEQALMWLQNEQSAADADCGDPACDECDAIVRPRQRIIDALREALK